MHKHIYLKGLLGLSIFCMLAGVSFGHESISDSNLAKVYEDHQATFEKVRKMVTADRVSYISENEIKGRISDSRKQEYTRLLASISSHVTIGTDYDGTVRFIFMSGGGPLAISPGWLKGVEYISGDVSKKGKLASNLDNADKMAADVYLRPLESNWYIVYQRTDE